MDIRLGEYVVGVMRLTLFQNRITGEIFQPGLQAGPAYVVPGRDGTVRVFGQSGLLISPPLPKEALEAFTSKRTARKK